MAKTSETRPLSTWQQPIPAGRLNIEVAQGISTARELRTLLLDAAYSLPAASSEGFLILLFKSLLSKGRLADEMAAFRSIVRPDIAHRVDVRAMASLEELAQLEFMGLDITQLRERVREELSMKPRSASREVVVGMLLHRWLSLEDPIRLPELAAAAGASLPTVYKAIESIRPECLMRADGKRVGISRFAAGDWKKWLDVVSGGPKARFVDRSGSPRSPEKLARKMFDQGRKDVAVGGVLGARHILPGLDLVSAPHLDILVHGGPNTDLSFVQDLDPGLVRDDTQTSRSHVVVHYINRPVSLFRLEGPAVWGDLLDCMANLWAAGLTHQVEDIIKSVAPGGMYE